MQTTRIYFDNNFLSFALLICENCRHNKYLSFELKISYPLVKLYVKIKISDLEVIHSHVKRVCKTNKLIKFDFAVAIWKHVVRMLITKQEHHYLNLKHYTVTKHQK